MARKDVIIVCALLLIPITSGYEITHNMAFHIGSDKNETIRVNDTTYNGAISTTEDFSYLEKKYIASNRTSILAMVFAGSALTKIHLDTDYSSESYLFQVRQSDESNRLLIAFTNSTWEAVEDDLDEVSRSGIIAKNFAKIFFPRPLGFFISLRLEYRDIDIGNSLAWSGIGKLVIRNNGGSPPNLTLERV